MNVVVFPMPRARGAKAAAMMSSTRAAIAEYNIFSLYIRGG